MKIEINAQDTLVRMAFNRAVRYDRDREWGPPTDAEDVTRAVFDKYAREWGECFRSEVNLPKAIREVQKKLDAFYSP